MTIIDRQFFFALRRTEADLQRIGRWIDGEIGRRAVDSLAAETERKRKSTDELLEKMERLAEVERQVGVFSPRRA
jgi:hypothetical protein